MIVRFHISSKLAGSDEGLPSPWGNIAEALVAALREKLDDGDHPDLIHVYGLGDHTTHRMLERAAELRIPAIITPLCSLQPWNTKNAHSWKKLLTGSTIVASSQIEYENLQAVSAQWRVQLIENPVVTTAISTDDYRSRMLSLYEEAVSRHDQEVRQQIQSKVDALGESDAAICSILQQVLYVHYQHHRGHITQECLDQLSNSMIASNYDEALMAFRLDTLQMTDFFAQLETLLQERSNLTEGFMPIEAKPNKITETRKI